jgi:molybdate transport system substrate-binding protein
VSRKTSAIRRAPTRAPAFAHLPGYAPERQRAKFRRFDIAAVLVAIGSGLYSMAATAAEIRVTYPPPMHTVLAELLPRFERTTGHRMAVVREPSAAIIARLAGRGSNRKGLPGEDASPNGVFEEAADVVVLTSQAIDELVRLGKLDASSRTDLARSRMGVAVRAGAPKPDVATAEALRRTLLAAKSFARNEGADSGVFMAGLIDRLGIAAVVKSKTTLVRSGYVAELVARGEAEIAVQQVAELMAVVGVEVTPFPDELQHVLVFAAARPAAARESQAARELTRFLASPESAPVYAAKGLLPM